MASIIVFIVTCQRGVQDLTTGKKLSKTFNWPFFVRILAGLFSLAALVSCIINDIRLRKRSGQENDCDPETVTFLQVEDGIERAECNETIQL